MYIIGMGSEIVECLRIAQMIDRYGELFVERIFTNHEVRFCAARTAATQNYASHWAAKEAVAKALGIRQLVGFRWSDIEIYHPPEGPVSVRLGGRARELAERRGVAQMNVSLAFCRTHATAHAIALGASQE